MSSPTAATPAPGASLAETGKQYSQASSKAIKKLNSIDKKFEDIANRVEGVAAVAEDPDDVSQLLKAKNELAQIIGDLERLQFKELDAVDTSELNSGKAEARHHRKALNAAVDSLLKRTQDLHSEFISTVEKIRNFPNSPDTTEDVQKQQPQQNNRKNRRNRNRGPRPAISEPNPLVDAVVEAVSNVDINASIPATATQVENGRKKKWRNRNRRNSDVAKSSPPLKDSESSVTPIVEFSKDDNAVNNDQQSRQLKNKFRRHNRRNRQHQHPDINTNVTIQNE